MTELLFRDDAYARECDATVVAADERGIRLDRTVFYPLGGGQPGDTGVLRTEDGATIRVGDTLKGDGADEVIHVPAPDTALPATGTRVRAELDWDRRNRHMRFHTCLHLLCVVVPYPVTGGRIASDKAHLDFDLQGASVEKGEIEAKLNALIAAGHAATSRWISGAELDASPELVKTMSVAPPRGNQARADAHAVASAPGVLCGAERPLSGRTSALPGAGTAPPFAVAPAPDPGRVRLIEIPGVDLQACGGTHVANTAEIGPVAVLKIRSEGRRNKRVVIAFAGEDVRV